MPSVAWSQTVYANTHPEPRGNPTANSDPTNSTASDGSDVDDSGGGGDSLGPWETKIAHPDLPWTKHPFQRSRPTILSWKGQNDDI